MRKVFTKLLAIISAIAIFSLSFINAFAGVYNNTYEMFLEDRKGISIDNQFIYSNSEMLFGTDSKLTKGEMPKFNELNFLKYYNFAIIQHNKYKNILTGNEAKNYDRYSYAFHEKLDTTSKKLQVISKITSHLSKIDLAISKLENSSNREKYIGYKNLFLALQYELKALVVLDALQGVEQASSFDDADTKRLKKAFYDLESALKNEAMGIWNTYKFDFPSYYSESDLSLKFIANKISGDDFLQTILGFSNIKYSTKNLKEHLKSDFNFSFIGSNNGYEENLDIKGNFEILSNIRTFFKLNSFEFESSNEDIDSEIEELEIQEYVGKYIALFTKNEEDIYDIIDNVLKGDFGDFEYSVDDIWDEIDSEITISKKLKNGYILRVDDDFDVKIEFIGDKTIFSMDAEKYGENVKINLEYTPERINNFSFYFKEDDDEFVDLSYVINKGISYNVQDGKDTKGEGYIKIKNYKIGDFDISLFSEDNLDFKLKSKGDNVTGGITFVDGNYSYYTGKTIYSKFIAKISGNRDGEFGKITEIGTSIIFDEDLSSTEDKPIYGDFKYVKGKDFDLFLRGIPGVVFEIDTDMKGDIIKKFNAQFSIENLGFFTFKAENGKINGETKFMNYVINTVGTFDDKNYDITSSFIDENFGNFALKFSRDNKTKNYKDEYKVRFEFKTEEMDAEGFVELFYGLKKFEKGAKVKFPEFPTEYKYIDEIVR